MSEIADFLRARYLEARKREEGVRRMKCPGPFDGHDVVLDSDGNVFVDGHEYPAEKYWEAASEPGADPFVIADLDAKLALVNELEPQEEVREPETDAQLHARFAHPAWEYRVTEGPRKQWDDIDVPPTDDNGDPEPGWERNIDAGRDGWERWDYTEESYWRRLRPGGPRPEFIPRPLRILAQPFAGQPGHKGKDWAP